jgi:hypothetical protein
MIMSRTVSIALAFLAFTSLNAAKPGALSYAVAVNEGATLFGTLDIGAGTFHAVATLPTGAQGIARDARGRIYVIDNNNNLATINPGNGRIDVIGGTGVTTPGPVGPVSINVFASLATGEMFVMDYSNNLYSVDPETGAATLIGATGIPAIISPFYSSSLAGDCNNLYFTIDEVDENRNPILLPTLYRIDPHTAVATVVGPTHSTLTGSAFVDGNLYAFSLDRRLFGGTDLPQVFSIDHASGSSTPIATLDIQIVAGAVRFTGAQSGRCNAQ